MQCLIGMVALTVLLLVGCERAAHPTMPVSNQADRKASARNDWQEYRPVQMFSFRAPQGLQLESEQAVDSAAGVYTGSNIKVVYDYGWYADPLTHATDPIVSRQHLMEEGFAATLVESEQWAAVHFPTAHGDSKLTVTVQWTTQEGRGISFKILRSVRIH